MNDRAPARAPARREFLRASLAAAAWAAVAAPRASHARIPGANDRIHIGIIGCGGMGTHHVNRYRNLAEDPRYNIALAAVCDIYKPRLARAVEQSGGARGFHDYRKMLDLPDLDAVLIATPDHWHARMAIDALEAGKDVHVEKPMTLTWEEARDLWRTAERTGRIVQVGAEGCSDDLLWRGRELIEAGQLGKIVWSTGGVFRNNKHGDWNYDVEPECTPDTLDWDAFLGPAPKRPFDPERFFRYRKYWDYSGGLAHDLLAHILSGLLICLKPQFPRRVMASGGIYVHHDRETPDTFHVMLDYPGDHSVSLFTTQTTEEGIDFVIRGEHASLRLDESGGHENSTLILKPEREFAEGRERQVFTRRPRPDHDENWIACMRSREAPVFDARMGYQVMVALDLANRSWREGKMMLFDPEREEMRWQNGVV